MHKKIMWKSSAQLESLDHILHGGSSKKIEYDKNTNWMNLEPCIHPGVICLPCMYQFESDLQMIPNEVEYQLKVFEVKDTWYTKVK